VLLEARKSLRKRRIPAMLLNVSLAFHHPSMRVLRDLSLRRLGALDMAPPRRPALSCVTTGFYPPDQPGICRHIADLDEHAVCWTESVRTMWQRDGIRHFLELGPQDTLCGLTTDNEPRARCLSVSRKGHETEALRRACAQLYAMGHLRRASIAARLAAAPAEAAAVALRPLPHCGSSPWPRRIARPSPALRTPPPWNRPALPGTPSPDAAATCPPALLEVLARASGRPPRSCGRTWTCATTWPCAPAAFAHCGGAGKSPGRAVNFEDLLRAATVGDLARLLGGGPAPAPTAAPRPRRACPAPLLRLAPPDGDAPLRPCRWIPAARACRIAPGRPWPCGWKTTACCRACCAGWPPWG
jgi:hypothetical protein